MECRSDRLTGSNSRDLLNEYAKPRPRDSADPCPDIDRINAALNRMQQPWDVNESTIEDLLCQLQACKGETGDRYRLLTARLLEAALLCAGHYADNCEFTAAGDLLVNPRRILIHIRGCRHPVVKRRHGRLSEQLAGYCDGQPFPEWFRCNAVLEVAQPALVPDLLQCLERFQCFRADYLESVRRRMEKAAGAMGFLSAWGVSGWEELHRRLHRVSPQERSFVTASLCGFNRKDFNGLGRDIERLARPSGARSHYLKA
jgi:hypothetical protein